LIKTWYLLEITIFWMKKRSREDKKLLPSKHLLDLTDNSILIDNYHIIKVRGKLWKLIRHSRACYRANPMISFVY
jgi:hypothetical protein